MGALTEVVQGWSDGLPFALKADGVAIDLSGMTVTAIVHDRYGSDVSTTGKVSVTGTTSGEVTWTPAAADLLAKRSPYLIRFKVVDSATEVAYFPNAEADTIVVHKE